MSSKKSIINCHTHIFTGNHVPPYLAKTFVPIVYKILHLGLIIDIFKWWYKGPNTFFYSNRYKKFQQVIYKGKMLIKRNILLNIIYWILGIWLTLQLLFIIFDFAYNSETYPFYLLKIRNLLVKYRLDQFNGNWLVKTTFAIILILFFPSLRNLLVWLLKKLFKVLNSLPGKQTKELLQRYLNIGRFAFHIGQDSIFQRLRYQYPNGTEFIVLQMDMEFMEAGKVREDYHVQLQGIAKLKADPKFTAIIHPFIFIDPRRMDKEPDFFRCNNVYGKIVLEDCTIKTYIEQKGFAGFKIYPALGYYPFDERLLPLWKYAAEHNIPIMTHCIRGTIFYRGKKKKEWDYHPIFEQSATNGTYVPLLLPETKNMDFSVNFTHPLNYLCLLDDDLLAKVLARSTNEKLHEIFGFNGKEITNSLKNLKICFGHFGGDDEWKRYFELDRENYSTQVIKNPKIGITFLKSLYNQPRPGKIEQLWKYCDWYSIICSMMLQYENIYSDISYISHDNAIHALLKRTLQQENTKLRQRVLFGTDFYVVRNHKSEKQILADTIGGLSEEEFDLIARTNPRTFLEL